MTLNFDDEWGQARAGSSDQRVDMRLNSTDGPGAPSAPGGPGNFASTPAEKTAAANTIENELEPRTKTATEHADEATKSAVAGFEGWDTAVGLKKVADTWDKQVANLMGRLSHEKGALRRASGYFIGNDLGLGNQFRPIASRSGLHGV